MTSRRQRKLAELIHQQISHLIQHHIRDPRLGFVTVTGVDLNRDYSVALVYVTLFDNANPKDAMKGLESASGYIRRELAKLLSIRQVPQLTFKLDTSFEYGQQMDTLLANIAQEEAERTSSMDTTDEDVTS
ncbi:30S ribosome-binding factor RbfA [Anaerolineales bacterium HSG6]|nr:30S ribosome-binding factor RbfA [Anaerolineales bacterium HSG6]MDM8533004.1 30S ribosome-binding factor RbfA [Anaerolineales bacterium HSG25]